MHFVTKIYSPNKRLVDHVTICLISINCFNTERIGFTVYFLFIVGADVDECLVLNGGCQQACVNTPGSHHCACSPGFRRGATGLCEGEFFPLLTYLDVVSIGGPILRSMFMQFLGKIGKYLIHPPLELPPPRKYVRFPIKIYLFCDGTTNWCKR